MSIKQYKFISPGVFINEIDQSVIPREPGEIGPVIIGTAERGPSLIPITCQNYEEFFQIFGKASPGLGNSDSWRRGNDASPTYGSYAAQAYFRNGGPVTFVKLAGLNGDSTIPNNEAGWKATKAYGLFVGGETGDKLLSSVFYVSYDENAPGSEVTISASASDKKITVSVLEGTTTIASQEISFDKNDSKFIRKVFNTNPTLTNRDITDSAQAVPYWLGQTFESSVQKHLGLPNSINVVVKELTSFSDWKKEHKSPETGWVIKQAPRDLSTRYDTSDLDKRDNFADLHLFKFHSLRGGEWEQRNIKISIQDIKPPANEYTQYGTFSILVREASDTDVKPKILERYTGVNLDQDSDNYIAKVIGDRYYRWTNESGEKKYIRYGNYDNVSRYLRVEMKSELRDYYANAIPFGFEGPKKQKTQNTLSFPTYHLRETSDIDGENLSSDSQAYFGVTNYYHNGSSWEVKHTNEFGEHARLEGSPVYTNDSGDNADLSAPKISFVFTLDDLNVDEVTGTTTHSAGYFSTSSSDINNANSDFKALIAGLNSTGISDLSAAESIRDLGRPDYVSVDLWNKFVETLADEELGSIVGAPADPENITFEEKMEDLQAVVAAYYPIQVQWSYSHKEGHEALLEKHDRFTMPMHGGHDGLDITEKNPFRNSSISSSTKNYQFSSIERALDAVSDPEVVEMNLLSIPGLTNRNLTKKAIDICETRGDALAIIDIEGDYLPSSENSDGEIDRYPHPQSATTAMKNRAINSSYGACFYPWVTIRDESRSKSVDVPPSVAMLGVMASSSARSELWFAPAGFTRGGLSQNQAAGLPVVDVKYKLSSKERDLLYENNINPIASFPNEGIVVFGQKTLQLQQSALDRINVRRLMIYVKKEISRMSATLLFEPNVSATWSRFISRADPFLKSVQSRFGLTEYKIILDESTTTPELIDRNIMYAKIFLKPARAIEFIAIDFTITNSGASFEDL